MGTPSMLMLLQFILCRAPHTLQTAPQPLMTTRPSTVMNGRRRSGRSQRPNCPSMPAEDGHLPHPDVLYQSAGTLVDECEAANVPSADARATASKCALVGQHQLELRRPI